MSRRCNSNDLTMNYDSEDVIISFLNAFWKCFWNGQKSDFLDTNFYRCKHAHDQFNSKL